MNFPKWMLESRKRREAEVAHYPTDLVRLSHDLARYDAALEAALRVIECWQEWGAEDNRPNEEWLRINQATAEAQAALTAALEDKT